MTTKLAELWLSYALDDLQSARVLLKEKIFNMVCFHSQQAVEKLFKAFIAIHHQEIPRTHNLIRLHKICEEWNNILFELSTTPPRNNQLPFTE